MRPLVKLLLPTHIILAITAKDFMVPFWCGVCCTFIFQLKISASGIYILYVCMNVFRQMKNVCFCKIHVFRFKNLTKCVLEGLRLIFIPVLSKSLLPLVCESFSLVVDVPPSFSHPVSGLC
jgi:hypothetical protein